MSTNTFNGLEMLKIAMIMEDEGREFYTEGAKNTVGDVREFLLGAAAQELGHKEIFSKMYDDLASKKSDSYEYMFEADVTGYLKGLIENQVFDKKEAPNKDAFKDMKSALEASAKTEERTVEIYKKMYEGITNPEAKEIMKKIIDEEVEHAAYFRSLL
jgi:rubrerythrin